MSAKNYNAFMLLDRRCNGYVALDELAEPAVIEYGGTTVRWLFLTVAGT